MLINLLTKMNERFHHQHHLSSVLSVSSRCGTGDVFGKNIKYLHPPSIRA